MHSSRSKPNHFLHRELQLVSFFDSLHQYICFDAGYPIFSEANNFADQAGVFEIRDTMDSQHKLAMKQVVPEYPLVWCNDAQTPVSMMGNFQW